MSGFLHSAGISSHLYFAQHLNIQAFGGSFRSFRLDKAIKYRPFCDDFGPMNLACVVRFIRSIDAELASYPTKKIVWCIDDGKRNLTNAVFLLGAYMILKQKRTASDAAELFSWIDADMLEPFRDAAHSSADFRLHLIDCWRGLEKGMLRRWVRFAASGYMWGAIDIDEYAHYDDPANGDLQEVVPGKVVALKDPVDLGGADYRDSAGGVRDFSPSFYADVLAGMGVSTVVQAALRHGGLHVARLRPPPPRLRPQRLPARRRRRRLLPGHRRRARRRGGALPDGAGADGDARGAAPDAVARLHGAGGDGVAAHHAAWIYRRGAAALPVLHRGGQGGPARPAAQQQARGCCGRLGRPGSAGGAGWRRFLRRFAGSCRLGPGVKSERFPHRT